MGHTEANGCLICEVEIGGKVVRLKRKERHTRGHTFSGFRLVALVLL